MKNLNPKRILGLLCFIFILSGLLMSCSKRNTMQTGESMLNVPGGNIWYKVTGSGTAVPLVMIHGGPGMSSIYLKSFEELGNDRQVVRYDQLGGGKSDRTSDTSLFTIGHFVQELELLREHLGLEKWNVFGHSWGTVVALEYYRTYPDHVASLTFGSLCIDVPGWAKSAEKLLKTLPDSLQQAVRNGEATGKYDDPGYLEAVNHYYSLYVFRKPVQPDLDSMMSAFNTDIYNYMWGPSEFTITGTLKDYDPLTLLPEIKVPTLFTVGEFDEIDPEIVKDLAGKVPGSKYVMFPGSAHMTPWDARDESIRVLREFLNSLD
jgi:proline iminopeptidase